MTPFTPHIWPYTATVDGSDLLIGSCRLRDLAQTYGTPLYVFDEATLRGMCQSYKSAFAPYAGELSLSYASKALLNLGIAKLLLEEGFGFDAVSLGEIQLAMAAGATPEAIHLHGNAKPRHELEAAIQLGIGRIVVDNLDEVQTLASLTTSLERPQQIILRVEPAVAAATHSAIQTGQRGSKFGLSLTQIDQFAEAVQAAPNLELVGLHFHLGSQLFDLDDYETAVSVLLDLAAHLRDQHGIAIREISPGGGLATAYVANQQPPAPAQLAEQLLDALVTGCATRGLSLPTLILEPGRSLVARAGVALYEVIGSKPIEGSEGETAVRYLHVDGGMGDNMRPALYDANYTAVLANRMDEAPTQLVHLAGRYCESGDILLRNGRLPEAKMGDIVAFATAGAYTLSMANNYNLVPRPAVVMVKDGEARLIQRRETFEDLMRREL